MNQHQNSPSLLLAAAAPPPTAAERARKQLAAAKRKAERRRRGKRVAPDADADADGGRDSSRTAPEASGRTDGDLTRCTRCPAHRRRDGTFRPLIGNGEHVCDSCYRREFPATAFVSESDDCLLRQAGRRGADAVRDAVSDNVADVLGRAGDGAPPALSGADGGGPYPSEVECRACLERGALRRCCGEYYCHACYYLRGSCPSCGAEAVLTGAASKGRPDPSRGAVLASWALSAVFALLAAAGLAAALVGHWTRPTTVWGHTCKGWFADCDLSVCVEHDAGDDGGSPLLPAPEPYDACSVGKSLSAPHQVGSACIYDAELYHWSDGRHGYDLCVASPREEGSRPRSVSSADPLLLHDSDGGGVYLIDDDFERPAENAGFWSELVNAERSSACGANRNLPERGDYYSVKNTKALVFTGVGARQATSVPVNVSFGGTVMFYLKMGPIIPSDEDIACLAAFTGDILLEFMTRASREWTEIASYPVFKFRGHGFKFVQEEIPIDALTNGTQFRISQVSFDPLRDHWAIDDFRVMARFDPMWIDSSEFERRKAVQGNHAKLVQCCYNTDTCSVFTRASLGFNSEKCATTVTGFKEAKSRLNLDELIVVYVCVISVAKSVYGRLVRGISTGFKGSIQHVHPTTNAEDFPKRTFRIKPNPSWQYTASSIVLGTFAFSGYWLFRSAGAFAVEGKFLTVSLLAAFFDMKNIITLLSQVLHLGSPWKSKQAKVQIDLHPVRGFLGVEGMPPIPLARIASVDLQTRTLYVMLATNYVLAGFPLAVGSLALRSLKLPAGTEFLPTLVGSFAMLRELFGLGAFARISLALFWIFSANNENRDEFGRSMMRDGLVQQCALWAFLSPAIMFVHMGRQAEPVSTEDGLLLFTISFVSGAVLAAVVGALRGLPVCTECILSRWPGTTCLAISFEDRINCPCLFTMSFCGQIHTVQRLLVLTLDDYLLRDLLQGKAMREEMEEFPR